MARQLLLLAGFFLLFLAAPAGAHDAVSSHTDTRTELASLDIAETVDNFNGRAVADAGGLPRTWCGQTRTTDDVEHAASGPDLAQFKLVYAYPSDRESRFSQWRDALQADVALIGQFMGAQSGGRKAPRFDMGTSCGPEYADIQVVALPKPRAAYVNNFNALQNDVRAQLTHKPGQPRNVVVLADTLSGSPVGWWSGLGSHYIDERPGAANYANTGGMFSALYVPDGEQAPGADANGWWPEGMLHEMTHNLGGVGADAPHATPRRPLHGRPRRHVLRRRLDPRLPADHLLRPDPRRERHVAGLRLRRRRLLQRLPARRELPRRPLERLRQRLPRRLRVDRPRLRRRLRRDHAGAPGRHRRPRGLRRGADRLGR